MTWFMKADTREAVLAAHPTLAPLWADFVNSFQALPQIPAEVLALCEQRVAQLHGNACARRGAAQVTADKLEALACWHEDSRITSPERACLEFTEVYVMDVHAISDEQANAVKQYFGEQGLVALIQALGLFNGECRLEKLWQLPGANSD